jgi:hypothetical protein
VDLGGGDFAMSLSYYYEFTAPAATPATELEVFLREVEQTAKALEFNPTTVLNVPFDTAERREFASRLGGSFTLQDDRLKGISIPESGQLRDHNHVTGECRLIPQHGVVLVVTDKQGCEACFGFFKFPDHVIDIHGAILADTNLEGRWWFRDFIDSPDPRYRKIMEQFKAWGFVHTVKDEFA